MNVLAIIPARGGSKRIPHKNIRLFAGKPIISYSISAARASGIFDEVVVSTDDEEIATIAKQYGASVPFIRPVEIADDQSGIIEVVAHAIRMLEKQGEVPDFVCTIYATAPLIQPADIIQAYEMIKNSDKDFVFTVTNFPAPIFRAFSMQKDGTVKMFWPDNYSKNSQELPEAYHDAAQFIWGKRSAYLKKRARVFSSQSVAFPLPHYRVMDIDTMDDWHHAELLYKLLQ